MSVQLGQHSAVTAMCVCEQTYSLVTTDWPSPVALSKSSNPMTPTDEPNTSCRQGGSGSDGGDALVCAQATPTPARCANIAAFTWLGFECSQHSARMASSLPTDWMLSWWSTVFVLWFTTATSPSSVPSANRSGFDGWYLYSPNQARSNANKNSQVLVNSRPRTHTHTHVFAAGSARVRTQTDGAPSGGRAPQHPTSAQSWHGGRHNSFASLWRLGVALAKKKHHHPHRQRQRRQKPRRQHQRRHLKKRVVMASTSHHQQQLTMP